MKKSSIAIIGLIVVLLGAGVFAFMNRGSSTEDVQPATSTTEQSEGSSSASNSGSSTQQAGAYVAYSDAAVKNAQGTKILFFHAPWCPQCKALDASIKAGKVPDGVTIFKVDYDSNQALRKQYGVTIQTTLVSVDGEGKLVKKYVAYDDPTLQSVVTNLVP